MFANVFSVACGVFFIWMAHGFASMVDPELQGAARQSEIWRRLTTNEASSLGFGVLLIGAGLWLALCKPRLSA
jgi:hypothetical protein